MIQSTNSRGFAAVLFAAAWPAGRARRPRPRPVEAPTRRISRQVPAPAPVQRTPSTRTRCRKRAREFYEVLEQYPPALGRVMRLDPTLMTNQTYLASYPNVGRVPRPVPGRRRATPATTWNATSPTTPHERARPKRAGAADVEDALEFIGAFAVFCVVVFALFSLIKYIVEYRRWHRISKVNAEVHNKILDRFGSNEELLAYIDSPAGRRFLEATPIAPSAAPPERSVGAPFGRILHLGADRRSC